MIAEFLGFLGIDEALRPNAIGGLFSFAGVVITGLFAVTAWLVKQYLLRREKRQDLRYALRAEIEVEWLALFVVPRSDKLLEEIEKRMTAKGGESYTPYFSRHLDPLIFGEVKAEITALGSEEIPHIVRFYHHLATMENFVGELRHDDFGTYPVARKMQMIRHLFLMIDRATEYAEEALAVLDRQLRIPHTERIGALKRRIEDAQR